MQGIGFGIQATSVWDRSVAPEVQVREHLELLTAAEELGFSIASAGQHFLGSELRYYQPVPYLTFLSQRLPRMRVATGITLLSLVNPVEVAEQIATLDVLSGGRAILGVGLGYSEREFRAFRVERSQRVRRFEEGLELIKALWSGETVTMSGLAFDVEDVTPSVMPLQRPRPPIWVGGQSEKAVRRAAARADAWYAPPFPTHDGLARLRECYLDERSQHGLPLEGEFPVRRELTIADTREEALHRAAALSSGRFDTYLRWGLGGDLDEHAGDFSDLQSRFIAGSPQDCAETLDRLRSELGMTHFMFKPQWPGMPQVDVMRQLERFGTEVMPMLAASATA